MFCLSITVQEECNLQYKAVITNRHCDVTPKQYKHDLFLYSIYSIFCGHFRQCMKLTRKKVQPKTLFLLLPCSIFPFIKVVPSKAKSCLSSTLCSSPCQFSKLRAVGLFFNFTYSHTSKNIFCFITTMHLSIIFSN